MQVCDISFNKSVNNRAKQTMNIRKKSLHTLHKNIQMHTKFSAYLGSLEDNLIRAFCAAKEADHFPAKHHCTQKKSKF